MKKSRLLSAASAVIFLCTLSTINAATVLDQSYLITPSGIIFGNSDFAQTFTVGVTGQLSRVEVDLSQITDGVAYILPTISGVPGLLSNALGQATLADIPPLSPPASLISIDFSHLNLQVNADDVFAIAIAGANKSWVVSSPPTHPIYAGGDAYLFNPTLGWGTFTTSFNTITRDFAFQTYVNTIPLPPALWLFGSGLLGLVGMSRRRKSS